MTFSLRRAGLVGALALAFLAARPVVASADVTFFVGLSPTPESRPLRGFAAGIDLLLIGFELDYSDTSADEAAGVPGLRTGMLNAVLSTPTSTQLYLTAGGGFYRERLGNDSETSFGTNIGGGIKASLAGPLQLRIDYRIFNLRGGALHKNPQRFYVGLNLSF